MTADPLLTPGRHITYEQWLRTPETNQHVEVEDGEIVVNSATWGHQRLVLELYEALKNYVPGGYVVMPLPQTWVLRQVPLLVREPDLIVVRDDLPVGGNTLPEPPLLAAEVLSPSTRRTDLVRKRQEYAVGGLQHYLIGDPDGPALAYYRLEEGLLQEVREMSSEPLYLPSPFDIELDPRALL